MWINENKEIDIESLYFVEEENNALKKIYKEHKKHLEQGCECELIPYGFRCKTHKMDMIWNGTEIEVKQW